MGNKTQTAQTNQTTTPVNQAALQQIYGQVSNAASTPYTPYSGELTAGINGQQTAGINATNSAANIAQPYYSQAGNLASSASNPLTASQIQQYQNPYTQNVVNATQAQFNDLNGQQQNSLKGTAAQQGALGGDRQAVAQSQLAGQQALNEAPTIANLYANSYNSGLSTAAQQYQQNPLAAASALAGVGSGAQTAALQGAGQQINAGTLQQQTQQAADTANYGQYQAAQGFPFQEAAYLEQYGLPAALGQGTTASGTQTTEGPTNLAPYLGAAVAGAGLVLKDGGRVGYASGGSPGYISAPDYITGGGGYLPSASPSQSTLQTPALSYLKPNSTSSSGIPMTGTGSWSSLGNTLKNNFGSNPLSYGSSIPGASGPTSVGGAPLNGASPYGGSDYQNSTGNFNGISDAEQDAMQDADLLSRGGIVHAIHSIHKAIKRSRGGSVSISSPFQAFDDGGDVSFADRFQPATDSPLGALPSDQAEKLLTATNSDNAVINPDSPFTLNPSSPVQGNPANMPAGIDSNAPSVVASDTDMPQSANPMTAALPPQITNPDNQPDTPSPALAYDGSSSPMSSVPTEAAPVTQPDAGHAGIFGTNLSDKTRSALVAAGLGIMASRSPFLGAAIGEGGLQGLKNYSESTKAEQDAAEKAATKAQAQQRIDLQAKQIAQNASQFAKTNALAVKAQEEKGDLTEYQKAEIERQKRDEALKLKTPIKVGESVSGSPIMALPRLNPDTNQVDLYPIGRDGSIAKEPIAPGSSIRPQSVTPPSDASGSASQGQRDPTAPVGSSQSRNQQFISQVAQEDPSYAAAIKKAADYELDPAKYASMRTAQRQKFINDVIQYDPNYNPQEVGLKYRAQAAFLPGTKNGDTVTAFNTAISHLDTLKQMYSALKNGDVQTLNHLKNTFQQQFGYAAPNDVAALSSIIGGEVVKATVGSQNALGDREEVRQSIGRDLSTQQADSVIDKYQKLMAGQLNARKFAYEQSTGLHNFEDKFLLPRSQEILHSIGGEGGSGAPAAPIPPSNQRVTGQTYPTPRGPMKWVGNGWAAP